MGVTPELGRSVACSLLYVIAGLVPAISIRMARRCHMIGITGSCASRSPVMTSQKSLLRQLALVTLVVELRVHPILRAIADQGLGIFLGDERVFHPIRNGAATFRDVHAGVVDVGFAGGAGAGAGRSSRPGDCGRNQAVSRSGSLDTPKCWWNQRAPPGAADTMPTGS